MKQLKLASLLLLLLCSSCFFLGPSHRQRLRMAEKAAPIDVAIIPGLPFKDGHWDTLLKARMLWSLYLYKHHIVKNIIYSGNAVHSPYKEGKLMAIYAAALGVDPDHIFVDTIAEHSTENLYYGYKLANKLGIDKSIAVATDPFQCYMLYRFSHKHFKKHIYFLPVIYDSIRTLANLNPEVDASPAFVPQFISLDERLSYSQRLKGTRGKNIKYDMDSMATKKDQ
ncbi:MAG: YdcF family protein [Flavipsychrobacter sp.]